MLMIIYNVFVENGSNLMNPNFTPMNQNNSTNFTPINPMLVSTPPHSCSSMTTPGTNSSTSSNDNWNTLSVLQQMQCNTDNLVKQQIEMQEMRKLIYFQQEQYRLSSRLFNPPR